MIHRLVESLSKFMCYVESQLHEMTVDSVNELQASATAALGRLTLLTYQQKQLVSAGDLLPVLGQVIRKRRPLTLIVGLTCGAFAFLAARSVRAEQPGWFSIGIFVALAFWLYRRVSLQREVSAKVRRHYASLPENSSSSSDLVAELKLNPHLSYNQHQAVNAGDAVSVAAEIAATRRKNGKSMMLGVWPVCGGLFVLDFLQPNDRNLPDSHAVLDFIAAAAFCIILVVCAFVFGPRECRVASTLDRKIADSNA